MITGKPLLFPAVRGGASNFPQSGRIDAITIQRKEQIELLVTAQLSVEKRSAGHLVCPASGALPHIRAVTIVFYPLSGYDEGGGDTQDSIFLSEGILP